MALLQNIAERMSFWKDNATPPYNFNISKETEFKFNQATTLVEYTPDASLLSKHKTVPVFIYGTHMEGRNEYPLVLEHHDAPAPIGFTVASFDCWRKNLGRLSFPIAMETEDKKRQKLNLGEMKRIATPALIKGQVFFLWPEAIFELDKRFRNGVQFKRKKVAIQIPFKYDQATTKDGSPSDWFAMRLQCWMYVGREEYWGDQFDGGYFFSPVQTFTPKSEILSDYYFFRQPDGEPPPEEVEVKLTRPKAISRGENEVEIIMEEYDPGSPASIRTFEVQPTVPGSKV